MPWPPAAKLRCHRTGHSSGTHLPPETSLAVPPEKLAPGSGPPFATRGGDEIMNRFCQRTLAQQHQAERFVLAVGPPKCFQKHIDAIQGLPRARADETNRSWFRWQIGAGSGPTGGKRSALNTPGELGDSRIWNRSKALCGLPHRIAVAHESVSAAQGNGGSSPPFCVSIRIAEASPSPRNSPPADGNLKGLPHTRTPAPARHEPDRVAAQPAKTRNSGKKFLVHARIRFPADNSG